MSKVVLVFILLVFSQSYLHSQGFTWKHGPSAGSQSGIYGVKGVSSPANVPGGRCEGVYWTDASGNFWIFGGVGIDAFGNNGALNDLWKFSPITNQWTWMSGDSMINKPGVYGSFNTPAASNKPAATRQPCGWRDNNNNLWFYGGWHMVAGNAMTMANHLWRYSISTNVWTYMTSPSQLSPNPIYGTMGVAAPSNVPADRIAANGCADAAGNFLMFGGQGSAISNTILSGYHNDLWHYNVSTNMWTWLAGTSNIDMTGIYGAMGVPSTTNVPGARINSYVWYDGSSFWIFGGNGQSSVSTAPSSVYLNDVWRYTISNGQWTWLNGSNLGMQTAVYGTAGVFSASNMPGAHCCGSNAKDASGRLWVMGGGGITATVNVGGKMSDLWQYDPNTNQWAFMGGYQVNDQNGIYGTINVQNALNKPGGRSVGASWMDANNDFWTFGGFSWPQTGLVSSTSDMWKFQNCSFKTVSVSASPSLICGSGQSVLTATGAGTYTWSNLQTGNVLTVNVNTTQVVSVTGSFSNGCVASAAYTINAAPVPSLSFSVSKQPVCTGDTIVLSASGALSYSWSTGASTASIQLNSPPYFCLFGYRYSIVYLQKQ